MKNTGNKYFGIVLFVIFLMPVKSFAGLSPDEIMNKAYIVSYYQGKDGKALIEMKIYNQKGRVRKRVMSMLRKDKADGGEQSYFIHFQKPNDVRNTTFLVKKYPQKNDDRWIFIPAIRMVKRIASSDKRGSFVGSDFTYEDISGRSPALDKKQLLPEEQIKGKAVYVIKNLPIDKKEVEYDYRLTYVDKKTFVSLKEVYFKKDKAFKEYLVTEVNVIDGYPTVISSVMKNLKKKRKTEIFFNNIKYDLNLPDNVFSERSLKKPPKRWIK